MDDVKLLPCPFCLKPAKLEVEEVRGDTAWCFIRCEVRCKVAPFVGESACIWYWSEGKHHRAQSDEQAKTQAKERAISAWNTRPELDAQRLRADTAEAELERAGATYLNKNSECLQLRKDLAAAEQRNVEMRELLQDLFNQCELNLHFDGRIAAALNPKPEAGSHE